MKKKVLPLSKVYQLLEPGPVVMVTTQYKEKPNIMTMSWQMMIDFVPPLVGLVISNRNYSFNNVKRTKQLVINIPSVELIHQVVGVGNTTGSKVNKFKKFHLTAMPASKVDVPLIEECFANLECKVIDDHLATKYNIFIVQVVKAWIATSKKRQRTLHHQGNGVFVIDGKIMKLSSNKK
ncbi:MAG TPA: flavin reductase family protein [Candidatus Babeliales bacterium]|nr:flavin reductase family protein [Candidatus Babeliales bacterium]